MAKEKPKAPAGIKRFAAMLGVVAIVPKEQVEARVEALKQARAKRHKKK